MKYLLSKKRKIISFFVVISFAISLISNTPVLAQNDKLAISDSYEEVEPTVIDWYLLGDPPEDIEAVSDKVNEYIRNKINAEIRFDFIEWANYRQKKEILYTSGEQIDIIFASDWWNYATDVSEGYYYPLNGLVDEYAPKTKAILGENVLKAAEIDDKIYALPIPGQNSSYASGIAFRKDLVKKYNIDLSKIKKIEDIEPILKNIKSKQPSIIPLINIGTTLNYDVMNLESIQGSLQSPGCLNTSAKNMKVYNEFTKAETKTFFKILNRLHKLSYLKTPKNAYENNEIYKAFAVLNTYCNPLSNDYSQVPERINIYLSKPFINNSSATGCMNAVSSNTANPELDMQLIELVNTDTYLNSLLHFGIEGEHYIKVSKNVIKYPNGVNSSNTTYPQLINWELGNRYLDFTFNYEDKNKYQALKKFNNQAIAGKTLGFRFTSAPVSKEETACNSVWNQYVPKLLTGEYDPEKYIPIINKAFKKAGVDKIIAEKQKQLNEWFDSQYIIQ